MFRRCSFEYLFNKTGQKSDLQNLKKMYAIYVKNLKLPTPEKIFQYEEHIRMRNIGNQKDIEI